MGSTLFEQNIEKSINEFNKKKNTMVTNKEILHTFFEDIIATRQPNFTRITSKKIAIVLLGQSCCGKTTYAKNFVKEHPDFTALSMDECAHRHLRNMSKDQRIVLLLIHSEDITDYFGNTIFGNILTEGKNLIIDGCWLHLNARSALFKTLHELGYYICIFSFLNIDPETYKKRIIGRALQDVARSLLDFDLFECDFDTDFIEFYAKERKLSINDAQIALVNEPIFKEYYQNQLNYLQNELASSIIQEQINCAMIYMGAEEFIDIFA